MTKQDIRWQQRFENFEKAVNLLCGDIAQGVGNLSALEQHGMLKMYHLALVTGMETLREYLEYEGVLMLEGGYRKIVKEAYAVGIIKDGYLWIEMANIDLIPTDLLDREAVELFLDAVSGRYYPALRSLAVYLTGRLEEAIVSPIG